MSVKSGQGNTATIHTVVVTTRVEATVVKVNPKTSQSVCVGQLHTNAPVTETALSTSAAFCVPKRRAIQRVLRMCTGSLPTPTSRSALLTCTTSVVRMVPHQTAALVMKVWWLCVRVELKGEPTREAAP